MGTKNKNMAFPAGADGIRISLNQTVRVEGILVFSPSEMLNVSGENWAEMGDVYVEAYG